MPTFICSSRYTVDSQILRQTAQSLGWETLRLDGNSIPDWFDPPDSEIAFFFTAPRVFEIARQLGRKMIGCHPAWTIELPSEFLRRELRQTTMHEALKIQIPLFVKHSVSKAFPAAVYYAEQLAEAAKAMHPDSLVHMGEPVEWECEYRCFVSHNKIMTVSPYVYNGQVVADYYSFPNVSSAELGEVLAFAESVLSHPEVDSPDAFVLDVGFIRDRGWAVVETNICWASGIYACDPKLVLTSLLAGNNRLDTSESKWDFQKHYSIACPNFAE